MSDLQRAIEIAVDSHREQKQKNGLPYILHPLTLMLQMNSDETRIAAVLHDVVEDTQWELSDLKQEGFSEQVLDAVNCLTHTADVSYDDYIKIVASNPVARQVKLADLKDNMNVLRIPELSEKDLKRIAKYRLAWRQLGGDE